MSATGDPYYRAALAKLQRDHSEALIMLSRVNEMHTRVLMVLVEKDSITREHYARIRNQVQLESSK